ncbi:MAG: YqgE/AlgH family protein [Chromatiales bacterium]|nr:YqgE/AlgH family protein [Chromatiales bacterium]
MHTSNSYLTGQFLIAMPALPDPNFSRTVSYICQHSDQGAMGLVINRPLDIDLEEILKHMDIEISQESARRQPVYLGGPVQPERGFVLHSPIGEWDSSLRVNDELAVTTSLDILRAIANGEGPDESLVCLGYAGWGAGQLEREIVENSWLNGPSDHQILFHADVEARWNLAAAALGVDLSLLSGEAGHG